MNSLCDFPKKKKKESERSGRIEKIIESRATKEKSFYFFFFFTPSFPLLRHIYQRNEPK